MDKKPVPGAYIALQERLAKYPEGATKADELFEIFSILFTEEEALVGSRMPMKPASLEALVNATGMERARLTWVVESMANKGLLIDIESGEAVRYILSPPMIGFVEYTFMKRNEHLPMKRLAELADAYVARHMAAELPGTHTERTRVVPYESAFGEMVKEVVPYERARELIRDAGRGALAMCYCRREAKLLGRGCDAPIDDICMGLGKGGDYLVRHGFARPATVDELLAKLDETEEQGLVHTSDNVQEKAVFMCHCCGCCCHILRGLTELHSPKAVAPSSFIAHVDKDVCTGCGLCEERCQIDAISLDDLSASVKTDRCIGCGICVTSCPNTGITLRLRENATPPPRNRIELLMRMAQEKDRLKYYM